MNTTLTSYITQERGLYKKFLTSLNGPFKTFSAAIIGLKVHIRKSECKANHKYQWSKVFQLHFSLIIT